ncbi:hypothetical protein V8D89_000308 [Ganoderma adspersum]
MRSGPHLTSRASWSVWEGVRLLPAPLWFFKRPTEVLHRCISPPLIGAILALIIRMSLDSFASPMDHLGENPLASISAERPTTTPRPPGNADCGQPWRALPRPLGGHRRDGARPCVVDAPGRARRCELLPDVWLVLALLLVWRTAGRKMSIVRQRGSSSRWLSVDRPHPFPEEMNGSQLLWHALDGIADHQWPYGYYSPPFQSLEPQT